MLRLRIIVGFGLGLTLAGCETLPMTQVSGDRSAGTVDVTAETAALGNGRVDADAALERCRAWGYSGAEQVGGPDRRTVWSGNAGQLRRSTTAHFRCTGK